MTENNISVVQELENVRPTYSTLKTKYLYKVGSHSYLNNMQNSTKLYILCAKFESKEN